MLQLDEIVQCLSHWQNVEPDSIGAIHRYEDLVASPLPMTEQLYNFMGEAFTEDIKEQVASHFKPPDRKK